MKASLSLVLSSLALLSVLVSSASIATDYAVIVNANEIVNCTFSSLGQILWTSESASSATFTDIKQQTMTLATDSGKFEAQPSEGECWMCEPPDSDGGIDCYASRFSFNADGDSILTYR